MNERDESMGDDSNSSMLPDFSFVCQSSNMSINEQPIKVKIVHIYILKLNDNYKFYLIEQFE
jgi:hypothetical protein